MAFVIEGDPPRTATVGKPYSAEATIEGGTEPFYAEVTGLPPGLSASLDGRGGQITGTPTEKGIYDIMAKVIDSSTPPQTATATLTLVIAPAPPPPLLLTTTALPEGQVGVPYDFTCAASGGTPPYSFTATGLAPGLTITGNGIISGTPTAVGTDTVVLTVTDSG